MKFFHFSSLLFCFAICFFIQPVQADPHLTNPIEFVEPRKININTADAAALANVFKGIGIKRAQAIVQYREVHGLFKSVDDLAQVKGIGENFIKKNMTALNEVFTI